MAVTKGPLRAEWRFSSCLYVCLDKHFFFRIKMSDIVHFVIFVFQIYTFVKANL